MYGESEARAYDALYRRIKDYRSEAAQVASVIRDASPEARTVLDVGCGTGNHLAGLASEFTVEGVEPSPPMAAIARRRLSGRPVHELDMRDFDLGRRFDAVISLFSSIGYMPTVDDLDRAIAAMAHHVSDGGVVIVEPWLDRQRWLELEEGQVGLNMVEADDDVDGEVQDQGEDKDDDGDIDGGGTLLVRMVRCWSEGPMSHMEMHYLHGRPDRIDHFVEGHRLRLFSDGEYRTAFERAGLSVERREPGLTGRGLYVAVPAARPEVS